MLINRLWVEAKQRIFDSPGVTKLYRPAGLGEFRLTIPLDPEQRRIQEEKRLQKKEFDVKKLSDDHYYPVLPPGPGTD